MKIEPSAKHDLHFNIWIWSEKLSIFSLEKDKTLYCFNLLCGPPEWLHESVAGEGVSACGVSD